MSVLETTAPKAALSLKREIESAIKELKSEEGVDMLFFFVVDIVHNESTLLCFEVEEQFIASKAFEASFDANEMVLEGVVSRKKQMVPALEKALSV